MSSGVHDAPSTLRGEDVDLDSTAIDVDDDAGGGGGGGGGGDVEAYSGEGEELFGVDDEDLSPFKMPSPSVLKQAAAAHARSMSLTKSGLVAALNAEAAEAGVARDEASDDDDEASDDDDEEDDDGRVASKGAAGLRRGRRG